MVSKELHKQTLYHVHYSPTHVWGHLRTNKQTETYIHVHIHVHIHDHTLKRP